MWGYTGLLHVHFVAVTEGEPMAAARTDSAQTSDPDDIQHLQREVQQRTKGSHACAASSGTFQCC